MQPQVLKPEQVTSLLEAPDRRTRHGHRDRAFLALMALGGLRIAEACSLRRDSITRDGATRITFIGKCSKLRTVTLPRVAAEAVDAALARHDGPYILGGDAPWPVRTARRVATRYFDACGFEAWVHPHSLRHTCATTLLRATNGDMRTVQRTLGHTSPQTTAKYYDGWDSRDSDRAAAALDEVFA